MISAVHTLHLGACQKDTLKIEDSFCKFNLKHHFESSKECAIGLQRWSVLLQMTTLSPALEGSGPEVGSDCGFVAASPAQKTDVLVTWASSQFR